MLCVKDVIDDSFSVADSLYEQGEKHVKSPPCMLRHKLIPNLKCLRYMTIEDARMILEIYLDEYRPENKTGREYDISQLEVFEILKMLYLNKSTKYIIAFINDMRYNKIIKLTFNNEKIRNDLFERQEFTYQQYSFLFNVIKEYIKEM